MRRGIRFSVVALLVLGACTDRPISIRPSPSATSPSLSPSPSPRTAHHVRPSPPADLEAAYPGWRVYWSPWEKASISYPRNWKAKISYQPYPYGDWSEIELTAPDGFLIQWLTPVAGIGGGCDQRTQANIFVDRLLSMPKIAHGHPLQIALLSLKRHKSLAVIDRSAGPVRLGDTGSCLYYPTTWSETHSRGQIMIFSSNYAQLRDDYFTPGDKSQYITDAQYLAQPDVKITLKIFRSLRY